MQVKSKFFRHFFIALTKYKIYYHLKFEISRYEWSWPYTVMLALGHRFNSLYLVLQVIFCHPPGPQCSHSSTAQPIRYYIITDSNSNL